MNEKELAKFMKKLNKISISNKMSLLNQYYKSEDRSGDVLYLCTRDNIDHYLESLDPFDLLSQKICLELNPSVKDYSIAFSRIGNVVTIYDAKRINALFKHEIDNIVKYIESASDIGIPNITRLYKCMCAKSPVEVIDQKESDINSISPTETKSTDECVKIVDEENSIAENNCRENQCEEDN